MNIDKLRYKVLQANHPACKILSVEITILTASMGIKYRCSCTGVYLLCKGRCQPSRDVTSASSLVTKVGDHRSFTLLDSYKPTHFSGWVVDKYATLLSLSNPLDSSQFLSSLFYSSFTALQAFPAYKKIPGNFRIAGDLVQI